MLPDNGESSFHCKEMGDIALQWSSCSTVRSSTQSLILLTQLLIAGKTGFLLHLFFSGRGIDVNKELDVKVLKSEAQVCVIQFFPRVFTVFIMAVHAN